MCDRVSDPSVERAIADIIYSLSPQGGAVKTGKDGFDRQISVQQSSKTVPLPGQERINL